MSHDAADIRAADIQGSKDFRSLLGQDADPAHAGIDLEMDLDPGQIGDRREVLIRYCYQ